jgi:hypothetical protein
MERIPITDKPNPNKPYNLDYESICFGNAWNPTNATCKNCNAIHACGTAQLNTNKQHQIKLENGTPFLSKCSFDKVDEDSLVKSIQAHNIFASDLLEEISTQSGFKDKVTLTNYLNQFLNRHNLVVKDGIIQ